MSPQKKIVIIAGPNGAGKTTFAREFLPFEADCPHFINADLIAAGLSPFKPEAAAIRAGRVMLEEIDRNAAEGRNFAFETTLAGHVYLKRIDAWRAAGYTVKLVSSRSNIQMMPSHAWQCVCSRAVMTCQKRSFAADLPPVCETFSRSTGIVWTTGNGSTTAGRYSD